MIVEHALLPVREGRSEQFEQTLVRALPIIRSAPGCLRAEVSRCRETPQLYLLLVEWERLEDHDPGFRGAPRHDEWRALLHPFYSESPRVDHYEPLGL